MNCIFVDSRIQYKNPIQLIIQVFPTSHGKQLYRNVAKETLRYE